jgi:hypothetical protein
VGLHFTFLNIPNPADSFSSVIFADLEGTLEKPISFALSIGFLWAISELK